MCRTRIQERWLSRALPLLAASFEGFNAERELLPNIGVGVADAFSAFFPLYPEWFEGFLGSSGGSFEEFAKFLSRASCILALARAVTRDSWRTPACILGLRVRY